MRTEGLILFRRQGLFVLVDHLLIVVAPLGGRNEDEQTDDQESSDHERGPSLFDDHLTGGDVGGCRFGLAFFLVRHLVFILGAARHTECEGQGKGQRAEFSQHTIAPFWSVRGGLSSAPRRCSSFGLDEQATGFVIRIM